jgi:hypothetical protein
MTPEIFPILGQPKSKLYFDLQAMIAVNGGRLKLAQILQIESHITPDRQPRQKRAYIPKLYKHYSNEEIDLIKRKIVPKGRNARSMHWKRWDLKQRGLL